MHHQWPWKVLMMKLVHHKVTIRRDWRLYWISGKISGLCFRNRGTLFNNSFKPIKVKSKSKFSKLVMIKNNNTKSNNLMSVNSNPCNSCYTILTWKNNSLKQIFRDKFSKSMVQLASRMNRNKLRMLKLTAILRKDRPSMTSWRRPWVYWRPEILVMWWYRHLLKISKRKLN